MFQNLFVDLIILNPKFIFLKKNLFQKNSQISQSNVKFPMKLTENSILFNFVIKKIETLP